MKDIGVDVRAPVGEWDGDQNCPFYGSPVSYTHLRAHETDS